MSIEEDRQLIEALGGPAKLAARLGYERRAGTSRIYNWTIRGIPPGVRLQYPKVFLKGNKKKRPIKRTYPIVYDVEVSSSETSILSVKI